MTSAENKGDLISRSELKNDLIAFYPEGVPSGLTSETMLKQILQDIDNAPTVKSEKAKEGEIVKAYTKGFDTAVEIARTERPKGETCVATSRIDDRLLRLERIISLLIKGGTIHLQEEEGWGITREELEFLRQTYKDIREEHHFIDDYIQDDHQEREDLLHSNDGNQARDRS